MRPRQHDGNHRSDSNSENAPTEPSSPTALLPPASARTVRPCVVRWLVACGLACTVVGAVLVGSGIYVSVGVGSLDGVGAGVADADADQVKRKAYHDTAVAVALYTVGGVAWVSGVGCLALGFVGD